MKALPERLKTVFPGVLLFAALIGIGAGTAASTNQKWEFLHSESGIRVFAGVDTALPTFKAEGIIPVNLLDLLAVISDVSRRKEWLTDITLSRILEGDIQSRVVIYERVNMPGPIKDRDCVVESVIDKNFEAGIVTVNYRQIEHPDMPPAEGYVRMPVVRGRMQYRFVDPGHTEALYETTLDIGGSLPRWMMKLGIKKVPSYSLNAIIAQVGRTKGQYVSFVNTQRARLKIKY